MHAIFTQLHLDFPANPSLSSAFGPGGVTKPKASQSRLQSYENHRNSRACDVLRMREGCKI